jgi:hypothetical protein
MAAIGWCHARRRKRGGDQRLSSLTLTGARTLFEDGNDNATQRHD